MNARSTLPAPAIPATPFLAADGTRPEHPRHPLVQIGFAYGLTFVVVAALAALL